MASTLTPSKMVSLHGDHYLCAHHVASRVPHTNVSLLQAASAIENLKMESPVKKLNFAQTDKENKPFDDNLATLEAEMDAAQSQKEKSLVKPTETPQQPKEEKAVINLNDDEPLLKENPNRFVLFPIQYHEVCDTRFH